MATTTLTGVAAGTATAGKAAQPKATLATNFSQFLKLLTTQLKNQSPLDPYKSTEFTQQLVSFSGVEQAIATNTNLKNLIALYKAGRVATAVRYLGTTIEAAGDRIALASGKARFSYTLPKSAASTRILITTESGKTVFSTKGKITAGKHAFLWNGGDTKGNIQPDGTYKIKIYSLSKDNKLSSIPTIIRGRVTRVETVKGDIRFTVNSLAVPIKKVLSIAESPPHSIAKSPMLKSPPLLIAKSPMLKSPPLLIAKNPPRVR